MSKTPDALRRISLLALVFIIFISEISLCFAATNEGYGEDETALGQSVDSFETSDNISVAVNVIQNSTLEVMELNVSEISTVIYNLTSLREHDYFGGAGTPDFSFTINNNDEIRISSTQGSAGRGYIFFRVDRSWLDDKYVRFRYYAYCDVVLVGYQSQYFDVYDGMYDRSNNTDFPSALGGAPWNPIPTKGNGVLFSYQNVDGLLNWFTKDFQIDTSGGSENNVTLFWMLSDNWVARALRLQVDWIEINTGAGGAGNLITINFNDSSPITMEVTGGQEDYGFAINPELPFLFGGFESEGYFSTVDYLNNPNVNGSGLAVLVNTTIPANTDIQFQISNDNATWTDHEGVIGDSEDLLGGSEAIDLRDLNYSGSIFFRGNLSTTDPSISPLFNQIRLITMIGAGPTVIQNITGEWIYYNLTAIANITGVHDEGFVNSTYFIDGDTWNCSEVVGAPGYIVNFNVTEIDTDAISLWLLNYVYYDGVSAHHIHVEAWNFTAPGWVEIGLIDDDVGFEWHNFTVYEMRVPNDFVNSTGAFVGRFNHVTAGNINDDIVFDRISLLAFVPSAAAGVAEPFQFFWIVIAIALMLIGIVLAKMWPEEGDP